MRVASEHPIGSRLPPCALTHTRARTFRSERVPSAWLPQGGEVRLALERASVDVALVEILHFLERDERLPGRTRKAVQFLDGLRQLMLLSRKDESHPEYFDCPLASRTVQVAAHTPRASRPLRGSFAGSRRPACRAPRGGGTREATALRPLEERHTQPDRRRPAARSRITRCVRCERSLATTSTPNSGPSSACSTAFCPPTPQSPSSRKRR